MTIRHLPPRSAETGPLPRRPSGGHARCCGQALTRRPFLRSAAAAAGAAGALAGAGLPGLALAAKPTGGDPKPIPWTTDLTPLGIPGVSIHLLLPGLLHNANDEPSSITDFHGDLAYAVIDGSGTGTSNGTTKAYNYEVDVRVMSGTYLDVHGQQRQGAFALL